MAVGVFDGGLGFADPAEATDGLRGELWVMGGLHESCCFVFAQGLVQVGEDVFAACE